MEIHNCLDLSERIQALYSRTPDYYAIIEECNKRAGFKSCERIYFGSSFCGQYFLSIKAQVVDELIKVCQKEGYKLGLVIPTFTQKNLERGKKHIASYEKYMGDIIDEIVVNDYGMLDYIYKMYNGKIKLNMGRLFMKDYREIRYPEYFNQVYKPKIFTPYLDKLIEKYNIKGMLFDATHKTVDFSEKPEEIEIGIYEPYTYMTVGQICELGSTHLPIEKKFRPNFGCKQECNEHVIQYFVNEGVNWLRIGRTIYFENRDFTIQGLSKLKRIYCPYDLEVKKCEC